ncbi:MAG TPA: hypothetical protein VK559_08500 [Ferruginibacter sp.]|nr:hypothetical protein [Ferruginibacter sp.]
MELSPKYKKWIKTFLILLIVRFAVSLILYFVIEYKFKRIIQFTVTKETKGAYRFEDSTLEVSLWNKSIIVNGVSIICNDTLHTTPHYDVRIPRMYLTIQSWKDLILHQTFGIDSLAVISPAVKIHEHREHIEDTTATRFHITDIVRSFQKILVHLKVRALHLENGSVAYGKVGVAEPLICNNIDFTVSNFTKENNDSAHTFASDNIDLSMNDQHWALPDGLHDINFKSLHFSGKSDLFELDSCYIHKKAQDNKGEITLTADKLFFNSAQLPAIYQKQQLIIDTLICIKPVLTVPGDNKDTSDDAKAKIVKKSTDFIFDYINFNYISIEEGQLVFTNKNKPSYGTQKATLKVYNLQINPDSATKIQADSILFNVKRLTFITKDSLFQLAVDEFIFKNSDLLFSHAVFGPTPQNKSGKGLTFSTPSLYLKNISLDALVEKRLKATQAYLYKPVISITANQKKKPQRSASTIIDANNHIYKILHSISELINVDSFHIVNGNLKYKLLGAQPITMSMKNVNADVLLHHFFLSDSLIDVKRSMPKLDIGQVNVQAGKITLQINDFDFKGYNRRNYADNFQLTYGENLSVKGTQLSWQVLDWDQYVNYRKIMIDHIEVNKLFVNSTGNGEEAANKTAKDLPLIHIDSIDVNNLDFTKSSAKNNIHLTASAIRVDNINSVKRFFTWNSAMGIFNDISFSDQNTTVFAKKLVLDNNYTNVIEGAIVDIHKDSGYTKLEIPIAKIKGDIHSSDFGINKLTSFIVEDPTINIYNTAVAKKKSRHLSIPLNFNTDNLLVNNSQINYVSETTIDSSKISAKVSIAASEVHGHKEGDAMLEYKKIAVTLTDLSIHKKQLSISIPRSSLQLDNGALTKDANDKLSLTSGLLLKWDDAVIKNKKGNTDLAINNLSGSFEDNTFSYHERSKYKWSYLLGRSAITKGDLHLKGKTQTINIRSYSWLPAENTLHIKGFDVTPNLSMEETFKKAKWQADYVVIKGDDVTVNNLHINQQKNDSSITADKIIVNNVSLTASRDKRMPFHHNIEKPMPTKLISAIAFPFSVNTVVIENSAATVQEISAKTNQMGIIPLKNINGTVSNIGNINNKNKNLTVTATASLFSTSIRHFYYSERYDDSLSNFTMSVNVSPINFVELNPITKPLAAIEIEKGSADTLFANWRGNKYAAVGKMNLYYKDLAIKILDPVNPTKNSLKLRIENGLAGNVVNPDNKKETLIFFERDRGKFIFNDWLKTVLKGALSSIGLQKDSKYIKHYNELHKTHPLPPIPQ